MFAYEVIKLGRHLGLAGLFVMTGSVLLGRGASLIVRSGVPIFRVRGHLNPNRSPTALANAAFWAWN